MDELIPALKSRYRVADARVGVDGVSMGGARSMYYGFKYPEVFSSIGSVQGAFGPYFDIYRHFVERHRETLKKRSIQLVTSDRDPMAPSVERMHQLLLDKLDTHLYLKLTGPHDYIFNQGTGRTGASSIPRPRFEIGRNGAVTQCCDFHEYSTI